MFRHSLFLFSAVLTVGLVACRNSANQQNMLSGRWELTRALRNGAATETLAGTYFLFDKDGKMSTNLPVGAATPTAFELTEKEIRQKSKPPVKYQLAEISDTTLVLTLEMRGISFEMHFQKVPDNAGSEQTPPTTPQDSSDSDEEELDGENSTGGGN